MEREWLASWFLFWISFLLEMATFTTSAFSFLLLSDRRFDDSPRRHVCCRHRHRHHRDYYYYYSCAFCALPDAECDVCQVNDDDDNNKHVLTNALLHISYDGSRFTGWSAANDKNINHRRAHQNIKQVTRKIDSLDGNEETNVPFQTKRRDGGGDSRGGGGRGRGRNRGMESTPYSLEETTFTTTRQGQAGGFVRSVQGVLQHNLAKLYGNVDVQRMVVEGCSRTDKGVHARGMIAHIYCYRENAMVNDGTVNNDDEVDDKPREDLLSETSHAARRRKPHPLNATDSTYFVALPKSLDELRGTLNRMLPWDLRVTRIAPPPNSSSSTTQPFHPTRSASRKTYQYRFSLGPQHDPTQWRTTWHLEHLDLPHEALVVSRMQEAARILHGRHDFAAFQGAPCSASDKRKRSYQSTICTLDSVRIDRITDHVHPPPWPQAQTYQVTIQGDRFLYKMVRFLVGALVSVGVTQRLQLSNLQLALDTGNRSFLGTPIECAPAHGLVLAKVDYDQFDHYIQWQT